MPLGLPPHVEALLVNGPTSTVQVHRPDGSPLVSGGADRQRYLDELTVGVRSLVADRPFWPGDYLVRPPAQPRTLPYQPYR